jgi:hypothetical protein
LLPAGQRTDRMASRHGTVEQALADEAGSAGDRQRQRGDQGLASAMSSPSSSSAACSSPT